MLSVLAVGASSAERVGALQATVKLTPTPTAQNVGGGKPESVEISR